MPKGWARYGAKTDIFRGAALNPVANPADDERFCNLYLWGADEERLESLIRQPGLVSAVVTGPNGSGRTTMARYIVGRYKSSRAEPNFAFAEYEPGNIVDIRTALSNLLRKLAVEANRTLGFSRDQDPYKALMTALSGTMVGTFEVALQTDLQDFSDALHRAKAGFGCVLENVHIHELMTGAHTLFELCEGIVVYTITDAERQTALGTFLESRPNIEEFQLNFLPPRQVGELVKHRWDKWSAQPPLPLDPMDLQPSYESRVQTIGGALEEISGVFKMKLANCGEGDVWPADRCLILTRDQIDDFIRIMRDLRDPRIYNRG